jgi:hypothetical protein
MLKLEFVYSQTLDLLHRELDAVLARDVVIQLALTERDITRDGTPRAGSRPTHPGVILSFQKRAGWNSARKQWDFLPLSFPCQRFVEWESNLRAIALALEALRKVDRYGITQSNEQYRGWAQLPSSTAEAEMSPDQAATVIANVSDFNMAKIVASHSVARDAVRQAMSRSHPDKGGNHDVFVRVGKAREVLAKHHGVSL